MEKHDLGSIHEQLKDKYDLLLTNTFALDDGYTIDVPVLRGVSALGRFDLYKEDEDQNKYFEGGRPSSIIIGDQLTPGAMGALLSHFENKIMFQGFTWNLNSFDQEGVQLGKVLAKKVLAHDTDGALKVYSDLLNI